MTSQVSSILSWKILMVYRELNERKCLLFHVPKYWFTLGSGKIMWECAKCGVGLNTNSRIEAVNKTRLERGCEVI